MERLEEDAGRKEAPGLGSLNMQLRLYPSEDHGRKHHGPPRARQWAHLRARICATCMSEHAASVAEGCKTHWNGPLVIRRGRCKVLQLEATGASWAPYKHF